MDQQCLHGIADTGPMGLGVEQDLHGHVLVGGLIDEDVDVSLPCFDDRHGGVGDHGLDQVPAAAGNQDIHPSAGFHQDGGACTAVLVHGLDCVSRQANGFQGFAEDPDQHLVGGFCRAAAAEDDGVATFEGKSCDV